MTIETPETVSAKEWATKYAKVEADDTSLAQAWIASEGGSDGILLASDGYLRHYSQEAGLWIKIDDKMARGFLSAFLANVGDAKLAMASITFEGGETKEDQPKEVQKLRRNLRSNARLQAVYSVAVALVKRIEADAFDADPYLLATPSGVVELRDGTIRQAKPEDMLSISTGVEVGPEGAIPARWIKFLAEVFPDDAEMAEFMQRLFGMALTGDTSAQKFFAFHGRGADGKSVMRSTILHVFGEYGGTADARAFVKSRNDDHPTTIASLRGKRLVLGSELAPGRSFNEPLLKDITGGERISARFMHKDPFEYTPRCTLIITGNSLPSFASAEDAMARRVVTVPFPRSFAPDEQDPRLVEALRAEGPAILRWVIEGAVKWFAAGGGTVGLAIPKSVADAGMRNFEDDDIILQFLRSEQEKSPGTWYVGAIVPRDGSYSKFSWWLKDNGLGPWSSTAFGKALNTNAKRYGLSPHRSSRARSDTVLRRLVDPQTLNGCTGSVDAPPPQEDSQIIHLKEALSAVRRRSREA